MTQSESENPQYIKLKDILSMPELTRVTVKIPVTNSIYQKYLAARVVVETLRILSGVVPDDILDAFEKADEDLEAEAIKIYVSDMSRGSET